MTCLIFGTSFTGLPILAYQLGNPKKPKVLLLGGVHGDEPEGVYLTYHFLAFSLTNDIDQCPFNITMVPTFNIDGCLKQTRTNARGVDLNRNLPTEDWSPKAAAPRYSPGPHPASEPENQGLIDWLEKNQPELILSLHSWKPMINLNGNHLMAQKLAKATGYAITDDMGYKTLGSLGTFAEQKLGIPVITFELEEHLTPQEVKDKYLSALIFAFELNR